ncbi:MAG: hypothetical protein J1E39_03540 [Eubacterium sp.]|nr:hypothetical protein [Eubacterium sp.]
MANPKGRSYRIALCGILCAICVIMMFFTGVIPIGAYLLPAVAGIVIWVILQEINLKWALLSYAAVALLAMLLTPDIESKLLFAAFFGYYPSIRDKLARIKPKLLSLLARFAAFNIPVVIVYFLLLNVLGMAELMEDFAGFGEWALLILWGIGNFTFICYDICLDQLSFFYDKWLKRKIHRVIK